MDVEGMKNARLGVVYLWQGTKMESALASTIVSGVFSGATNCMSIPPDINIHSHDDIAGLLGEASSGGAQGAWAQFKAWAEDFCRKMWAKIQETFKHRVEFAANLKNLIIFVAKCASKAAAPFIGAAADMAKGLWKTTTSLVEKISSYLAGRNVEINFGHPKTLVEGVEQGITRAVLEGVYELAKGSISMTLNVVTAGAAAVVDAIAAVVEAATKIIWRYFEYKVVNRFIARAKEMWALKDHPKAPHTDATKFNEWLQYTTKRVPIVAAVTLGSGIAGDKMRYLKMYTGSGDRITQSQFSEGVGYLDQLKRSGARMIERTDIDFTSTDATIAGLLKLAKSHDAVHVATKSRWRRFFHKADKVVRA